MRICGPKLSHQQIKELTNFISQNNHTGKEVKRAQAIVLIDKEETVKNIAAITGLGKSQIFNLRKSFLEKGIASIEEKNKKVPNELLTRNQRKEIALTLNFVASSLISVFRHLWKEFWGPRLEHILYNSVLALMDTPGNTLLGVYRLLVDDEFRKQIVTNIKDPVVRMFWIEDYAKYDPRFRKEIIAPVQNKIGQLITSAPLRNIVGQAKSSVDLGFVMEQKRILLANLSKGKIGEDKSNLLGSTIVTKMYLAALERQNIPEEVRKDFYLYIDEFQNFSTDIFPSILSEARKYRLNLNIAHQYLYQLPDSIKHAVFGNVGTIIAFRTGSYDAKELAEEMKPVFTSEDLEHLDNHHIALRLLIDGKMSHAFSAITFPPLKPNGREAEKDTILKISRERYATPRDIVEEKLKTWFEK